MYYEKKAKLRQELENLYLNFLKKSQESYIGFVCPVYSIINVSTDTLFTRYLSEKNMPSFIFNDTNDANNFIIENSFTAIDLEENLLNIKLLENIKVDSTICVYMKYSKFKENSHLIRGFLKNFAHEIKVLYDNNIRDINQYSIISEKYLNQLKTINVLDLNDIKNTKINSYQALIILMSIFIQINEKTNKIEERSFKQKDQYSSFGVALKSHINYQYKSLIKEIINSGSSVSEAYELIDYQLTDNYESDNLRVVKVYELMKNEFDKKKLDKKVLDKVVKILNFEKKSFYNIQANYKLITKLNELNPQLTELIIENVFLKNCNINDIEGTINKDEAFMFFKNIYNDKNLSNLQETLRNNIKELINDTYIKEEEFFVKKYTLDKHVSLMNAYTNKTLQNHEYLSYLERYLSIILKCNVTIKNTEKITITLEYEKDIYNKEREKLLMSKVLENKGVFISTLENNVDTENKAREYILKETLLNTKTEKMEDKIRRKI